MLGPASAESIKIEIRSRIRWIRDKTVELICILYSTVVHSSGTVLQKLTRGRLPPPFPHLGGHGDEYGMAQVDHHVSAEDQPELGARRQLVLVGGQGGEHAQYGAQ